MSVNYICLKDNENYKIEDFPFLFKELSGFAEICDIRPNGFTFKFTGVLIINNMPVIIFPKNYPLSNDEGELSKQAATLIKVLVRYRNEPFHDIKEKLYLDGEKSSNSRIVTAIQLIEDYVLNGLIRRDKTINSSSKKGRIDWNATINKKIPIINHRSVVYNDPVIRSRVLDSNNVIYLLHQYVISECISIWGWMFNLDRESIYTEHILPCSVNEAIIVLKKELKNTYIQREINVIRLLIDYFSSISGQEYELKREILGTRYFSYVWEAICGYLFDNKYVLLKKLLPQPKWESNIVSLKIAQRPDIFFVESNNLYIIDAKYYNYNNNLPGWHDVVKQFFYYYTLKQNLKKKKYEKIRIGIDSIYNVFLFPGNNFELLSYIGHVYVDEIDDLGKISAYAINQERAFEIYAFRNNDKYKKVLQKSLVQYSGHYV